MRRLLQQGIEQGDRAAASRIAPEHVAHAHRRPGLARAADHAARDGRLREVETIAAAAHARAQHHQPGLGRPQIVDGDVRIGGGTRGQGGGRGMRQCGEPHLALCPIDRPVHAAVITRSNHSVMLATLDDTALTPTAVHRCALYWVPSRGHPLWQAGCEWLGRDPERPRLPIRLAAPHEVTREPRRYGFHATLKAPLRLREGVSCGDFMAAVRALAARHSAFEMPALEVRWLSDFLALQPLHEVMATHPLRRLADDCVRALDGWRAPLSDAERARHCAGDDAERRLRVECWGYPHVFEHWRLHITLSIPLPVHASRARHSVEGLAREHFAQALSEPMICDEVAVFVESGAGGEFTLLARVPLRGATS